MKRALLEHQAAYSTEVQAEIMQSNGEHLQQIAEGEELQMRVLEAWLQSSAALRSLKLQMSRWRLDYQRQYLGLLAQDVIDGHGKSKGSGGSGSSACDDAAAENSALTEQRLRKAQLLVRSLWRRKPGKEGVVSLLNARQFLSKVAAAAAQAGQAGPILAIYEGELAKYNPPGQHFAATSSVCEDLKTSLEDSSSKEQLPALPLAQELGPDLGEG